MGLGEEVSLVVEDGVATIFLDRTAKLNAINGAMLDGLEVAFDRIDQDRSIGAAVIAGAGDRAFTVGIDTGEFAGGAGTARAFVVRELTVLYDRAVRLRVPVIAAVEGLAYATGSEFTMCCDIAYAGEGTTFCFPDLNIGLGAASSLWKASEKLSRMRLTELLLTGRTFNAQEAYEIGLITRVVPKGTALETAHDTAKAIAAKAPIAVEVSKQALSRGYAEDWLAFLQLQQRTIQSKDFAEGLRAFQEKREPKFRGV